MNRLVAVRDREGLIITEELYAAQASAHKKFIPVLLNECEAKDIPDVLRPVGTTHYRWPAEDKDSIGGSRISPASSRHRSARSSHFPHGRLSPYTHTGRGQSSWR